MIQPKSITITATPDASGKRFHFSAIGAQRLYRTPIAVKSLRTWSTPRAAIAAGRREYAGLCK